MSNVIKLKRGNSSKIDSSKLQEGELALATDTNRLYSKEGLLNSNVQVGTSAPTDSSVDVWINPSGEFDLSSMWNKIYPVGCVYETVSSSSPSSLFGGTWTLVNDKKDIMHIGSQVIFSEASGYTAVGKTAVLGAYDHGTIFGVFDSISAPVGYHREYRISFQASTGGGNSITVYLNNIQTTSKGTWSSETFRIIGATDFFKESDIIQETTLGYGNKGTNLYYSVSSPDSRWHLRDVMVHGYFVSDDVIYRWKRIS